MGPRPNIQAQNSINYRLDNRTRVPTHQFLASNLAPKTEHQVTKEVQEVVDPLYTTRYLPKQQHINQHLQPHGIQAPAINTTQVSINQNTQIKLKTKIPTPNTKR